MDTHFDFPHSDFQQINLDWMLDALKTANDNINALSDKIAALEHANDFTVVADFVRDSAGVEPFTIQLTKPCKEIYIMARVPSSTSLSMSQYDIYSGDTIIFNGVIRLPMPNRWGCAWGHALALDRYPILNYQTVYNLSGSIDSVGYMTDSLTTKMGYTELTNFSFTSLNFYITSGSGNFPAGLKITIFGR